MSVNRYLFPLIAAALVACGTVAEQPVAPAETPKAEAAAPVPATEPAPAPQPVAAEVAPPAAKPAVPAARRHAAKVVKVAKRAPAPTPAPAPATGPTEQEIAAALAYVDESLGRFMLDQVRFNAPPGLKRDATGSATLEFSSGAAFDKARDAIAANEQVRRAGIQVSSRVQGRLTGENIAVKGGAAETQELSGAAPGHWSWQLTPTAEGKAKLHLVISVDTVVAGSSTPRAVHTLDRDLMVEAAAAPAAQGGFLSANWWWMLLLLIMAVAGGWFALRKSS